MLARATFWTAVACLAWAQAGYGAVLTLLRRARGNPPVAPAGADRHPARVADRGRLRGGGGDRRQGRRRARARLAARPAGDRRRRRRRRRAGRRRDRRARPRRRRRPRARAAARRQGARAGRRRRRLVRRAAGLLRRQRGAGSPARCARCWRRSPTRGVGYVCGQVRFVNDAGTNQEGALLALRDVAARPTSPRSPRSPPATAPSTPLRRSAYLHVDAVMGHDLAFPFGIVKRGLRAVYAPGRARDGEDGPLDRGRVAAQAADDEPRVADRPARRHALPARLPAALRADDRLAPGAALRVAAAARRRRGRDARAAARGRVYRLAALAQAGLLGAAAAGGRVRLRPALVARYYVATTASLAAGLYDHLRHGTPAGWEAPEGTR